MKRTVFTLMLALAIMACKAAEGEKPSKDSNQKVTKMSLPEMDAMVLYMGGDTLYLKIETTDQEPVSIKLMGGSTTLLNDHLKHGTELKRVYVISAFPEGDYKIRLKKGNYVVEKKFTKTTTPVE
jgi:hypothetical protein